MARALRLALACLLGLVLLAGGALAAFLYLPALEGRRQALAETVLLRLLERPAEVAGPVRLTPGAVTEVTLGDITLGDGPPGAWRGALALGEARFGFPLLPALLGRFKLASFTAVGLDADLSGTEPDPDAGPFRAGAIVAPIVRLLDTGITSAFVIEDARIVRQGDLDGWNGEARIERLEARESEATGSRVVTLAGTLEGSPLRLEAEFSPPYTPAGEAVGQRDFTIISTVPGIEQRIEGTIDIAGETLAATATMRLDSLGDLLEVLRLRRQLEGSGTLAMRLSGEVDALEARAVALEGRLATGERLEVTGGIGNLNTLAGIDLDFRASLLREDGTALAPLEAFDIAVRGVQGHVDGTAHAATLSGLLIDTNIAAADIAEIGPVRVERVTRDDDGRLGLRGIHVLSGDPARPSLDLRGDVEDALAGRGIRLEGGFDLDFMELATGEPGAEALGRLVGRAALADDAGFLVLRGLSAEVTGGGPLAFSLAMRPGNGEALPPIDVRLDIADLDALARVLGAEPVGGGGLGFEGRIDIDDDMHVVGDGQIGRTAITADIRQDVVGDQVTFKGRLESAGLHLADLQRLAALPRLVPAGESAGTGGERTARPLDAELDVEAIILDDRERGAGEVSARLYYHDGEAALRPLRLDYLGGRLEAEVVIGTPDAGSPVTMNGSARRMNLAGLLRELDIPPLVTGTLDGRFDLRAQGIEPMAAKASLGGMIEVWVEDGTIGTNLVDLTGQDLVSWLISRGSTTRLVCADMRLDFADGRGTFGRLVLETDNVQIRGTGSLDLGRDRVDLAFEPRPLRERLLGTVTPFRIEGQLSQPSVAIQSGAGIAGRAITETLTLPLNVLGAIIGGSGQSDRRPCMLG